MTVMKSKMKEETYSTAKNIQGIREITVSKKPTD